MTNHAIGTFRILTWDENPYDPVADAVRLTQAAISQSLHGDIEGTGTAQLLIVWRSAGQATFMGLQRIVGRLGNRSGSFVLQMNGLLDRQNGRGVWSVVPDSASGDLRGLSGEGAFELGRGQHASYTLNWE